MGRENGAVTGIERFDFFVSVRKSAWILWIGDDGVLS